MLQTTLVVLITAIHKKAGTYKNCIDRFIILNNFSKPMVKKIIIANRPEQNGFQTQLCGRSDNFKF